MKFGHYWPKDPAKERIEHIDMGLYWRYAHDVYYSSMPLLRFEPFSVGGDDGSAEDTPAERAAALQRVRDAALGGVCGTVRHLP